MVICLSGMHRSGTSLLASYLHCCGISMGDDLVGGAKGNPRGHFEDRGFVALHDEILRENASHLFAPRQVLNVSSQLETRARRLIDGREGNGPWGWKDPRTTLLLPFWGRLLPDARFVLLYREPYAVIDSLMRRATDRRLRAMPWLCAKAWIRYNEEIVRFRRAEPDRCFLVNINGFNGGYKSACEMLGVWLGVPLSHPYDDVYHPREIAAVPQRPKGLVGAVIETVYGRRMNRLFEELEAVAAISSGGVRYPARPPA